MKKSANRGSRGLGYGSITNQLRAALPFLARDMWVMTLTWGGKTGLPPHTHDQVRTSPFPWDRTPAALADAGLPSRSPATMLQIVIFLAGVKRMTFTASGFDPVAFATSPIRGRRRRTARPISRSIASPCRPTKRSAIAVEWPRSMISRETAPAPLGPVLSRVEVRRSGWWIAFGIARHPSGARWTPAV